jgi:hypothetical protein
MITPLSTHIANATPMTDDPHEWRGWITKVCGVLAVAVGVLVWITWLTQ